MQRRNPASGSMTGASVDLTPLLDIIFIFLFIVIIAYTKMSQDGQAGLEEERKALLEESARIRTELAEAESRAAGAEERAKEAESKAAEAESRAEGLENRLAEVHTDVRVLQDQLVDQENLESAYERRLDAYEGEIIGKIVKIVTVYCTFAENDPYSRTIRLLTPDSEQEEIRVTTGNEKNGFDRLRNRLESYVKENPEAVFVLDLNTEQITSRDQQEISRIINYLKRTYNYVY